MRLRTQLIFVGLAALVLPWAGLYYVVITEDALRENEVDMLAKVAGSIADYIGGQNELVRELAPMSDPGSLYLHSDSLVVVDGYRDDVLADDFLANDYAGRDGYWDGSYRGDDTSLSGSVMTLAQNPAAGELKAAVMLSAVGQDATLFLQVSGMQVSGLQGIGTAENALVDTVQIMMGDRTARRHLFMPSGPPGDFIATQLLDVRKVPQYQARGAWHETAEGYVLELRFPRNWLAGHFGLMVEGADADQVISTLTADDEPPALVAESDALLASIRHFSRSFNIRVVDNEGWVRAARRDANLTVPVQRGPGVWLLEWVYRRFAGNEWAGKAWVDADAGRLLRDEVVTAMQTGGATERYLLADGSAVVSSAIRISDRTGQPFGVVVVETSSSPMLALASTTLVRFVSVAMLATVVLAVALFAYATWLSLRIGRLSRQVMTVMEPDGRELRALPQQTAADEIGDLGRNFARLLERVGSYTTYLQTLAGKLSHELRTPLAVVGSSLDNLEHEPLTDTAQACVRRARSGSERLAHILTAMSEATRVEQAVQSAERDRVDLAELLTQIVGGYRTAFPQQIIEITVPGQPVWINGNPELIAQLLDKLMDNAVDFCAPNGAICFALDSTAGEAVLSVANEGPRLPQGMQGQLFESMVSVRESKSESVHLGLGLTIVRLVAEFHGGAVTALNRTDSSGVVVSVALPVAA